MTKPLIFLDLDDTILDFHWAEHRSLTRTFREAGLDPRPEILDRYSDINRSQWELLERGILTREQVLVRRFQLLFEEQGIAASAEELGRRYEELLADGYRFIPGAMEVLQSLQGRARLFLASNGCAAVQEARIQSSGIGQYFENVFVSELMGADKPSEEYYRRCIARIPEYDSARAVMVGDSLTSDILGGIRSGMHTCWLNPQARPGRPDIIPEAEIRSISDLPVVMEKMGLL